MTRSIVVAACYQCPFSLVSDGEPPDLKCTAASYIAGPDDRVPDRLLPNLYAAPPDWCPLRDGSAVIDLEEGEPNGH